MILGAGCILLPLICGLSPDASSSGRDTSSSLSQRNLAAVPASYGTADHRRRKERSLEQRNNPLISLNLNLDALAQSKAAPRAQELLERIQALYQEGYYEVSPDTVSYNSVLKAWKEEENPDKAYELLQDMLQHQTEDMQVDVISLNTVILAFAKAGEFAQAEDLLRQMQDRDDLPDPDVITYNSVLYSFCVSDDPTAAIQAENLLREMMASKGKVTADTTSFNTVIFAFSQQVNHKTSSAARRAQELLDHMEQLSAAGNANIDPDVYSYTTVIQAWARCGQAAEAHKTLDRMIDRGLEPNKYTYTAVLSSLAKSGDPLKAEAILGEMMEAYEDGIFHLKPDTVSFSAVIDGWAKLSHVDKPEAAIRSLALLQRMKDLESEGMGPNARTYTSVFTALAKSGTWEACEEAQELLKQMEDEYSKGRHWLKPTVIQYNAVLLSFARSPRADKALKASDFFNKMLQHVDPACRPDEISYNTLLLACANAFGNQGLKNSSFKVAAETFQASLKLGADSNSKVEATSTTFAHFCKAARRLIATDEHEKRHAVLEKTLQLCMGKGMLNPVVVQQVQMSCCNEDEWKDRAGALAEHVKWKGSLNSSRVPDAWVQNARR